MNAETNRSIAFARKDSYLRPAFVRTESPRQRAEREEAKQARRLAMTRGILIGVGAIFSAECLFKIVELAFTMLQ